MLWEAGQPPERNSVYATGQCEDTEKGGPTHIRKMGELEKVGSVGSLKDD